ncbi:hypothetical protein [Clostridium beijerinckii]|uniref:hypothetical protein n=1 Tax=Clostridium beijerinckii TaxID=1520 RepID=UPI001494607C|nr:hypothetical protein [Clostridium beijerinckii]NOW07226.1 arsenate reductase-like glutaredoxin family protein [Clostridium beijerinckii]NYC05000.1 arsenate reductase-like glutaredoxin family protein [Clostridium beijerinckii]
MEYVIKNLKDSYIKGYLGSIINNNGFDNNFKVKLISNLINDIINETDDFERILNNDGKFSAILNQNNVGTINIGDDTLITEDSKTFNSIVNKVIENRNKLESIVDKVCSNRVSEMSSRVLDKLDNTMKKYINKQDEKFEKLNKQLDYLKFKSDLEDGLLDYDTIMDSALESDNENINLLASEYILTNTFTLGDLNLMNQCEQLARNFKSIIEE